MEGGVTPRMLTKAQAAEYCACATIRTFDEWRMKGIIPGAVPGTTRWDRKALDAALDRASGLTITPSDQLTPYQRWKADEASKAQTP
jgi:hypothetical protein